MTNSRSTSPNAPTPHRQTRRWRCPRCGRLFAKKNQAHSCLARPVEAHLSRGSPVVRDLYRRLIIALRSFGPLRLDAVKSSINLVSTYHFGSIAVRKDHLRLGFISARPIAHPRITRSQALGPNRYHHSLILRSPNDLDSELVGWLREAQELQSRNPNARTVAA